MTTGLTVYSNEVCKTNHKVWEYKVVVKSIKKAMRLRKVVIAIEKTTVLAVEETCLARHYYDLGLNNRQKTLSCIE